MQPRPRRIKFPISQPNVNASLLASLSAPLPPLPEQERIAAALGEQMGEVERARAAAGEQLEAAKALPAAYLRQVFNSPEAQRWPRKRLGDVLKLRKDIVHPHDHPRGLAVFVGLEHIESGTGQRTGCVELKMESLMGRKPRFCGGDIVYAYLRTYLNKVWVADFDGLCSVDQFAFEVAKQLADVQYVAWFMRSPVYLSRASIETTTGQLPRIGTGEVAAVEMPFPTLQVQRQTAGMIAKAMKGTRETCERVEEQLAALGPLPAALLRQAFTGEV